MVMTMNILHFNERFHDEDSCVEYFKEKRIREGVIGKNCKGKEYYWLFEEYVSV